MGQHNSRVGRYAAVSASLAVLSDRRIRQLVDAAPVLGTGIGGTNVRLDIEDIPVFVKRIPLTALERHPDNVMSTANLFGLPTYCHYGVGWPSFGTWRELAAHAMTTAWVLADQGGSFPLMYHWRVLDGPPPGTPHADLSLAVEFADSPPAVRARVEAMTAAPATLLLFLEHVPYTLEAWLTAQAVHGPAAVESVCGWVERSLQEDVACMNAHGLFHFDAHFNNILTDGVQLYLADFGLATSPRLDLSDSERAFIATNLSHDRCHTVTRWVDWLVSALTDAVDWQPRNAFIARVAAGGDVSPLTHSAAAIVQKYAPVAAIINEFYRKLHGDNKTAPYPLDELHRVPGIKTLNVGL